MIARTAVGEGGSCLVPSSGVSRVQAEEPRTPSEVCSVGCFFFSPCADVCALVLQCLMPGPRFTLCILGDAGITWVELSRLCHVDQVGSSRGVFTPSVPYRK